MATVRIPARQRRWPAYVIGGLVVLALVFTVMSTFYVDLLWFREVGQSGVFWTELRTKLVLGIVFGAAFFALLYANLLITRRISPPPLRFFTPEQEAIERVRMAFEPSSDGPCRSRRPCWRCSWASGSRGSGRCSCSGGTRAELHSALPSSCSTGTLPSTSSRCRG
jgi:hypothetical protein